MKWAKWVLAIAMLIYGASQEPTSSIWVVGAIILAWIPTKGGAE